MKQILLAIIFVLALSLPAAAAPINLSTFAPSSNPLCTLMGAEPAENTGQAFTGPLLPAVGTTVTISLVVTNGNFTGPNILIVNGTSFNYSVTLPLQVTTSAPGTWTIQFATPGCQG